MTETKQPYHPIPVSPDMPMWKELVHEFSNGYFRRVEALGSDETGYVVSVYEIDQTHSYPMTPIPPSTQHGPPDACYSPSLLSLPPRSFQVFMPLTAKQIISIFSYREPNP